AGAGRALAAGLAAHGADTVVLPEMPASDAGAAGIVFLLPEGAPLPEAAPGSAPLWVLTRSAVRVSPSDGDVVPVTVRAWGALRTAAHDRLLRNGGLVDLPARLDEHVLRRLCAVLSGVTGEHELAVRPGGVFARRLRPAPGRGAALGSEWRPSGTVMLAGPLDETAVELGRWAARNGADQVVLTEPDVRLEGEHGVVVRAIGDDLPVTAVVCTTPEAARVLDERTRSMELSAFVLLAPAQAAWGGDGASAHEYFNALAAGRREAGLPALSGAVGLKEPAEAVSAIRHALRQGDTTLVVADPDWAALAATMRSPLLEAIPEAVPAQDEPEDLIDGVDAFRRLLDGSPPEEHHGILLGVVRRQAAAILQFPLPDMVEPDAEFFELGFSSMAAVELRNRLGELTGLQLAADAVYDHPTPAELAEHLLAESMAAAAG
ncbi:beta-ketoacyl reductase, partial [Planomonospora algeriensis]